MTVHRDLRLSTEELMMPLTPSHGAFLMSLLTAAAFDATSRNRDSGHGAAQAAPGHPDSGHGDTGTAARSAAADVGRNPSNPSIRK